MPAYEVRRFGEKLRTIRTQRNLSHRALATALGVAHSVISEVETGKKRPGMTFVYAVSAYFGVSADDLLNDEREV
jgi:transcriptional regulator with XRE-family HTH domain